MTEAPAQALPPVVSTVTQPEGKEGKVAMAWHGMAWDLLQFILLKEVEQVEQVAQVGQVEQVDMREDVT